MNGSADVIAQALKSGVTPEEIRRAANGDPELLTALQVQVDRLRLESVGECNPIAQLARSPGHTLFASKTGAGKTSFLQALIADACLYFPECAWSIVTPKNDNFFGWPTIQGQRVVTYLDLPESPSDTTWVDVLHREVSRVYRVFVRRNRFDKSAIRAGGQPSDWPPVFLVIDEYFALYSLLKRLPKIEQEQDDGKGGLKRVKVPDERGGEITQMLQYIVLMGRSLGVYLILSGQSANCEEIGFSSDGRRNFRIVALGKRQTHTGTPVGYECLFGALNNSFLFADREQVAQIKRQIKFVIAQAQAMGDLPVALINGGQTRLWIVPDLREIARAPIPLPKSVEMARVQ
jgi:hypothetical protein